MIQEITVNNSEEFEKLMDEQDIRVSKALVSTIINNMNGRKRHLPFLSVYIKEEQKIYDFTVDREQFKYTLEQNLPIMEKNEMFEECSQIIKALEIINKKKK